ncbi:hypothetical protein [Pseudomonas amygdali]|uniref:Uncharacterized protein n=2 Tax=Pseudomonas amygdali pv. lachrymans TaxID=53707 RepID=A0ABR5KS27_PSEAV|nr:hypothetical protein [Pseudomonas amygdali]AXH59966.1 hypothetical protein PLA107_032590 [Pseudomonas amygdali pv. lachrymans str. M301315]KPC17367.1 Uncharacterized protein AC499_0569 [Pseudomonas amygdali pv. lachrymans]RMT06201.1 hypothetical protein ALP54_102763 [Pseudomonas amygdali pv. lachrymans]
MSIKDYFPIKEGDLAVMIGSGFFVNSVFCVLWNWAVGTPIPHYPSLAIAGLGFLSGRLLTMRAERSRVQREALADKSQTKTQGQE